MQGSPVFAYRCFRANMFLPGLRAFAAWQKRKGNVNLKHRKRTWRKRSLVFPQVLSVTYSIVGIKLLFYEVQPELRRKPEP